MSPRFGDYRYDLDEYFYKPIKLPKLLHEATVEELQAEIKRREEAAAKAAHEAMLREMTWANVMFVRSMNYNGKPVTLNQLATIAHGLGYKYFVCAGYSEEHVYKVLEKYFAYDNKNVYYCEATTVKLKDVK